MLRSWHESDLEHRSQHDRSTPSSGPAAVNVRYHAELGLVSAAMQTYCGHPETAAFDPKRPFKRLGVWEDHQARDRRDASTLDILATPQFRKRAQKSDRRRWPECIAQR